MAHLRASAVAVVFDDLSSITERYTVRAGGP
jgi:hypothetical protein